MSVKKIRVEDLRPGMLLAEPIFIGNNIILNSKGVLTENVLEKIIRSGDIFSISIFCSEEELAETNRAKAFSLIEDKTTSEELTKTLVNFREIDTYSEEEKKRVLNQYVNTVSYMKNLFDVVRQFNDINFDDIMNMTKSTIDNLLDNYSLVNMVKNLRGNDDYTYQHSVNVGILAGIIGRWMKMDKERLRMLVLAGIMHDIGKSHIPLEILAKPDKLTPDEWKIMKQHSMYGYNILNKIKGVPEEVALAALHHHERLDGSGYPDGAKNEKIHDFAKIIAVADTYDAVTSNRVYQKRRSPLAVMEILDEETPNKMDVRSSSLMLIQIRNSLKDKKVILKNNQNAKIAFVGKRGTDDLIVQTEDGRFMNIGKENYKKEILQYLG